jgi:hypothetical protein
MTPPTRPQPPLVDDGYYVEAPVPHHDPQPERRDRRRAGCSVLTLLAIVALSSIATPQGAPDQPLSSLDPALVPAAGAADVRAVGDTVGPALPGAPSGVVETGSAARLAGDYLPVPSVDGAPSPVAEHSSWPGPFWFGPTSEPAPSGEVGTALYSASATWCAPTPTQCQGWGGDAKLAAVNTFRYGDEPYWVRVWRGAKHVDVRVVSFCECGGSPFAIDLSVSAFVVLAPLERGRVDVTIEDLRGVAGVPLPQTDTGGER